MFRGPQADVQPCALREIALSGPAGTGKSLALLYKMHHTALDHPGSRQLIARKTRVSLTDAGLVTFEQRVLGEDHPVCSSMRREYRHSYRYPNGSEIVVGGMDRPTRLFSTEYDRIYVQEATELSLDEWESLLRSLRNNRTPYHQLMADCNPDSPRHWLYQRAQQGGCTMWHTLHEHNPSMHDGTDYTEYGREYIATLERLTGVRYKRLRLGQWVAAEGTVYEFDRAVHMVDRFDIPPSWRRYRAIDFGYVNPFVCQWWAVDDDGRAYLYREIYMTGRTVSQHATEINRLSAGERYIATVADHDAEDRATLAAHGIPTVAANKDISSGIQAVEDRLRVQGDGKPRLFVMRDSLAQADSALVAAKKPYSTDQEFEGYVWPRGADGKAQKEQPVKEFDHGMDACRYLMKFIDGGGGWAEFARQQIEARRKQ